MANPKTGLAAVIGCSAALFWQGAFIFAFPGVMGPHWQQMFHVGMAEIGNTLFFLLAALGIFMFFVGRWQHRIGVRTMISIGAAVGGLNMVFVAYASNVLMIYSWAFVMGAASCFVYIPSLTVVQQWYPAKRGLVSGIVNFTFAFSAAIMAPAFEYLRQSIGSVSMDMVLGISALLVGVIAAQFTDGPRTTHLGTESRPASDPGTPLAIGRSFTVRQALRTRSYWFLWTIWALQGAAGVAMVTLATNVGRSKGFGTASAVMLLTAFNVTNGLSRLVTGYLSDVVGRNSTMSVTFLAAGLAYLGLPFVHGMFLCGTLVAVVGFAFGTLFAVSAPLTIDCFGVAHFGAIFGLIFTAYGFVAGALGPSLSGYVLDATHGNFWPVFAYLGAFSLISSLLIRYVKPSHDGSVVIPAR